MATSKWRHPTLADTGQTAQTRCRCGRPRLPAELYDVQGISAAKGARYLCSACLERLHRKDLLDRVELHRAKGAPQDWLDWWEAKLLAGPFCRSGLPPHIWGEKLARGMDRAIEKARLRAEAKAAEPGPVDPMAALLARIAALEARLGAVEGSPVDGGAPTP